MWEAITLNKPTLEGAFVEMVVVVVSILIAFGLDAWWDGKKERREEREIQQALASEFDQIGEEIKHLEEYREDEVDLVLSFLEITEPGDVSIWADSLYQMLVNLFNYVGQETFPVGVLTSVISSGQLSLIQNQDLLHLLGGYSKELGVLREGLEGEQCEYRENSKQFLRMNTDVPQIHRQWGGFDPATQGQYSVPEIPRRSAVADHRPLLQNDEFRNHLVYKIWAPMDIQWAVEGFPEVHGEIVSLIRHELAEG